MCIVRINLFPAFISLRTASMYLKRKTRTYTTLSIQWKLKIELNSGPTDTLWKKQPGSFLGNVDNHHHHHLSKSAFSLLRGVTDFRAMMTLPPSTSCCLEHPSHLDQTYCFLCSPYFSKKSLVFLSLLCHSLPCRTRNFCIPVLQCFGIIKMIIIKQSNVSKFNSPYFFIFLWQRIRFKKSLTKALKMH